MHEHYQICRQFLKDFESYQLDMLYFHLDRSILPMKRILASFKLHNKKMNKTLGNVDSKSLNFIIKKRIDLIVMHIEIILRLLEDVDINEKDPFEIIRIFDKQHIFKKVLLSHLEDIKLLLKN
jgi:hypothetical protein